MLSDNPAEIAETEFELTPRVVEALGLAKTVRRRKRGSYEPHEPKVRMNQLALAEEVRRAINLAVAHAKNEKILAQKWGLAEIIPYGRSVTLLFAGPPGTGKSATAEALAHELGRRILVVNYAEIMNCYVGQTEKNIVRAFNEARAGNAVLFWDEADGMFYDRDSATRNWEVRDVNVLLQELERFEGVCILATNRKITLDKALERRITVKVEFERPNQETRRQIWEKLIPKAMPLAKDVNFDELSRSDLSGGEIKNVVLNAARIALERHAKGPICRDDFRRAVEMETQGRWNDGNREPIGFARN